MQTDMNALNQLNLRPVYSQSQRNDMVAPCARQDKPLSESVRETPVRPHQHQHADDGRHGAVQDRYAKREVRPEHSIKKENGRTQSTGEGISCRRRIARECAEANSRAKASKSSFRETYDTVARMNAAAARKASQQGTNVHETKAEGQCEGVEEPILDAPQETAAELGTEELRTKAGVETVEGLVEMPTREEPEPEVFEAVELAMSQLEGIDARGEVVSGAQKVKQEAWGIIRQSLTVISRTFHLNIASQDVAGLQAQQPDAYVAKQFSEILYALKSISQVLERAVHDNVALDMQDQVLEPVQSAVLEKTVRFEIFRLQLAFKMLGVSAEVNNRAAELQNRPVYKGIPEALDPLTVSQPQLQIRQFFANLVDSTEEQIRMVIARIKVLANEAEPEFKGKIILKQLSPAQVSMPHDAKSVDSASVDAFFFRSILKLDTAIRFVPMNQNPVEGEAPVTNQPATPSASTFTGMFYRQSVQQLLSTVSEAVGHEAAASAQDIAARFALLQPQPAETALKPQSMLSRTWDESVMMQIADRLSFAVKNGAHEVRLQLKPESLGEIHMKIKVEGDIVAAKINVESQQVRQIVENNLQSLRDALAEHHLQAGAFDVNVGRHFGSRPNRFSADGNRRHVDAVEGGEGEDEARGVVYGAHAALGSETGRRFGHNTIEYFA